MTIAAQNVIQKAAGSLKWSSLMEIISRGRFTYCLRNSCRLLTPDDFGVVAIAMIAISFAQMFWDAGLSKALIQTNEDSENAAYTVFWTNFVLGIMIYIIASKE
jgi:hypothetical protein